MTIKESRLERRMEATADEGSMRRKAIPLLPALIGTLAVMNVASVIMALIE